MLGSVSDKTNKLGCSLWLIISAKGDASGRCAPLCVTLTAMAATTFPSSPVLFASFSSDPLIMPEKTDGAGLPEDGGFDGLISKES
jgi:hypothetical protein